MTYGGWGTACCCGACCGPSPCCGASCCGTGCGGPEPCGHSACGPPCCYRIPGPRCMPRNWPCQHANGPCFGPAGTCS
ncbi:hypothetical protein JYU34_012714 [Plutella xylostella]|uniref:Uncharacterized protein n=1 Tax=Plutella xylostella TaxID=51655 RepID=A0ABQ7QBZ9_PLUXY|nr:hypothetical protein JYU34_012714 [Plutella xylostella]